jgi:protease I
MSKKILMVVAPKNYRDEEFDQPKRIFEQNEYEVTVASKDTEQAEGVQGGRVDVDLDITDVDLKNYDAIVFIGGPGAGAYFDNEIALTLAREAFSEEKVVAAICIAPSILANAGILKGKKSTVSSSEVDNIEEKGASYTSEPVTRDGRIITANGPQASVDFAKKIVEVLGK